MQDKLSEILKTADNSTESQPSLANLPFENLRILVAEDHEINQIVAHHLLTTGGATVFLAPNGLEVLRAWETEPFDLVLMDCQMPLMDGYEATGEIRRREASSGKRVPIIAMTANATESDR